MGQMVGHHVRSLAGHHCGMNLGIKRFTPRQGRFRDVDFTLALVKFLNDLFVPHSVSATEEIPVGQFRLSAKGGRRGKTRCNAVKSSFHWGKHLLGYRKIGKTYQGISPCVSSSRWFLVRK